MADMLVKLYELPSEMPNLDAMTMQGIFIERALPPDKHKIIDFVKSNFDPGLSWADECDVAFSNKPTSCFIAVKDKQVIGFCCYDATAKNFLGPTGVSDKHRQKGVGKAILLRCLLSMKEEGYAYAIIGWPSNEAIAFYQKTVGATIIENSTPGIYQRLIEIG